MNNFIVSLIFSTLLGGTALAASGTIAPNSSEITLSAEVGGSQSENTALSAQDTLMQIVNISDTSELVPANPAISSSNSSIADSSILAEDEITSETSADSDVTLDDFFMAETGEHLESTLNTSSKLTADF